MGSLGFSSVSGAFCNHWTTQSTNTMPVEISANILSVCSILTIRCSGLHCQMNGPGVPCFLGKPRSTIIGSYARPRDLRYFFVFLSPIFCALPITDRKDRPSSSATSCVFLFANNFLSSLTSSFDHKPLTSFFLFAIV